MVPPVASLYPSKRGSILLEDGPDAAARPGRRAWTQRPWLRSAGLLAASVAGVATPGVAHQAPAKPASKPAPATSQKNAAAPAPAAPQSRHYPILLIASGNEPFWSLRIGMKGAERLERAGYPPITLEPGEIAGEDSGTSWNYRAKDTATAADVNVRLSREACSDGMSDTKYAFKVVVTHSQIGELKGCARIAADQFPEFKQKNLDDDDPDKKKIEPPAVTGFKAPVAMAFLDPAGKVILLQGQTAKTVASKGYQLSLSHDGKKLLYTRDEAPGHDRTLVLYDAATGRNTDILRGPVQAPFWSPDDTKIAFLKLDGPDWHVWTMPAGAPGQATQLGTGSGNGAVWALHGWQDAHTVLASDDKKLYFLKLDSPPSALPIEDVYGEFERMSSDTIRANPLNPDLLLVTAFTSNAAPGMPKDPHTGLASKAFIYELKSKRQVVVSPPTVFAEDAEWARDGIQIFFTASDPAGKASSAIGRVFWDGSGYKRVRPGSFMVIGQ